MRSPLLAFALAYARHGWPVFPLHSPRRAPHACDCHRACGRDAAKHPRTAHGLHDASTDRSTIERWWSTWPSANIGVATGERSGLVVLDVDVRHDGDLALAALIEQHGALPDTPCVLTGGGGLHYYFAHGGNTVRNSAGKVGAGVDIRGDGGYVVAPPSVHASGQAYTWAVACELSPLPEWLHRRVGRAETHPAVDTASVLDGVPEGERDEALFRLACKLRRVDVPRALAEEMILRAAANCEPPFPRHDALAKVASAYDHYPTLLETRTKSPNRPVYLR